MASIDVVTCFFFGYEALDGSMQAIIARSSIDGVLRSRESHRGEPKFVPEYLQQMWTLVGV